jgi:hypothetical protein
VTALRFLFALPFRLFGGLCGLVSALVAILSVALLAVSLGFVFLGEYLGSES